MTTKKDLFIYNYDKLQEKSILQLQSLAGSMVFDGKIDDDESLFPKTGQKGG